MDDRTQNLKSSPSMVWFKVQSPAQGGGAWIALQWLHYTPTFSQRTHSGQKREIPFVRLQCLIMWWGHIIHRLVWERIGWGAPLLPNENQTMFKGTIKIFLQHFIHLGGRGSHPYQSDVHIRITFKERIFIRIKVNFERHEQWLRLALCVRLVANFRSG